jgi:tetratricopeptide (TPR) repeat protein
MGFGLRVLVVLLVSVCFWIQGCSSSYQTDLLKAEQLERDGKLPEALGLYERAIARIPQRAVREKSTALVNAGNCLFGLSRLNEAFADFQLATEVDPENLDSRLHLSEFLIAAGLPNKAVEHLAFVLSRSPENAAALGLMGTIEAAAGHFDKAKELLEKSVANDPQRPSIAVALAEIYNREDKVPDARSVLLKAASSASDVKKSAYAWLALGRLEEQEGIAAAAEEAYRSAAKAEDSVLTNLRLAQFLERSARIEEAEKVLQHVDSLRPAEPSALADFQLNRGRAADALKTYSLPVAEVKAGASAGTAQPASALTGRIIEAQIQLDRELKAKSVADNDFTAKSLLTKHRYLLDRTSAAILESEAALAVGDLAEAEVKARVAVEQSPDSAAAHYIRGVVFKRQEKVAEAKAEWNSALDADVEYVPARLALARQNLQEKDFVTAEEHASSVVRQEPANLDALCMYARVLMAQQRLASARSIVKRAIAVDYKSAEPRLILGEIETEAKRYGAAFLEFQRAMLLDSQSQDAITGLLAVYRHGVVTRSVLQKMERVAEAPPSSAPLLEIAGRLYADKHLYKDAVRVLQRVLEIEPQRQTAALSLAEAHNALGDSGKAAELMTRTDQNNSWVKMQLRAAHEQEGNNSDAAIKNYESALRSGDTSGLAANNLAWAYAQRGTNLDRAFELARTAVERNPKNAAVLDTLGVVQLKRRNYTEAVGAFSIALSLMQGAEWEAQKPDVYRHLADAYMAAGLPNQSASALAKAQQLAK